MNDVSETTILEGSDVKITNRRVVIGSKTYAMSNITSVGMSSKNDGGGIAPILLILSGSGIGFLALMGSLGDDRVNLFSLCIGGILGLALIGLGFYVYSNSKPVYIVSLGSSSGEMKILQSPDKVQIQRIVDAMNEAIVRR